MFCLGNAHSRVSVRIRVRNVASMASGINTYYALPLIGKDIKRWSCLTSVCLTSDVCLSRTSGLNREHRGLGRLKLVSVGTYWPWETTATLRSARRRESARRPQREERGGGISWRPPTYLFFISLIRTAIQIADITNSNCWYQQLLISTTNCRYH